MIGHLVGALEPEVLAGRGASYTVLCRQFHSAARARNQNQLQLPACTSHVRIGMTGFSKVLTFYMQLRRH
jgi:hypothetical protein